MWIPGLKGLNLVKAPVALLCKYCAVKVCFDSLWMLAILMDKAVVVGDGGGFVGDRVHAVI